MNRIEKCMLILCIGFGAMVHAMDMVTLADRERIFEQSLYHFGPKKVLLEGKLYFYGEGTIKPDYKRAFSCFEKAVNQNAGLSQKNEAAYFLGLMYSKGLGIKRDGQKAVWYLNEIYKQGITQKLDGQVHYELGIIYYNDKDYTKALEYYEKAAAQEANRWAQASAWFNLGSLYSNGLGVARSYVKARKYYEMVAEQDTDHKIQASAWYYLSVLYDHGLGVAQDHVKAGKYYDKAKNAQALAWYYRGLLYDNGLGATQDYVRARKYYEKAAEQNENRWAQALARFNLGNLYDNGLGVAQDPVRAQQYYEKIAAQNANIHFIVEIVAYRSKQ